MNLISPSYAQSDSSSETATEAGGHAATETHEGTVIPHDEHHGTFPPFDPATFGSQLLWLVICFGGLYLLMSRVALPRIGAILENRSSRIAGDLAEATRLKEETDAAIAAYEQALAEARQNAQTIAHKARDDMKDKIEADRARTEGELQKKLDAAEARITEVKAAALADIDAIAKDAAEAMVETLIGEKARQADVTKAVKAAMAEGS